MENIWVGNYSQSNRQLNKNRERFSTCFLGNITLNAFNYLEHCGIIVALITLHAQTMYISKHILLIDDDADHLSLCKLILERNGYEAMTSTHTDRLMDIVGEFKPDLILVDHNLKDITGVEVTKMIKSHSEFKHIPVIYFSSCDDIVIRAKEAGADDHLSKPFEFAKFLERAKKYLDKSYIF